MTRKPLHQFLPLTYKKKIPGVLDGTITQTIRFPRDDKHEIRLEVGDFVAFHGWEGRAYHSSWSFRTPYYEIILAKPIHVHEDRVYLPESEKTLMIGDPLLDRLAEKDGIEPATGEELLKILHAMHGPGVLLGKVLRWDSTKVLIKPAYLKGWNVKGDNSDPVICKHCLEPYQREGCSCAETLEDQDRFIQTPLHDPMQVKQTISLSAATLDDLFENPERELKGLSIPVINQRIFDKVRQAEWDLSLGVK